MPLMTTTTRRTLVVTVVACLVSLPALAQSKADLAFAKRAKQVAASRMKDPASAQFRTLVVSRASGERALCGEINAKNAFGAYVGFRPFIADEDGAKFMADSNDVNAVGAGEMTRDLFLTFMKLQCDTPRVPVK